MRTFLALTMIVLLSSSCTDKKKGEQKNQLTIQKIDSLEQNVSEDIKELKDLTKEVEENLKALDSI